MSISTDQLKQLQDKVTKLVADKNDADAKTQASNTADTAASQAAAVAAQAKLDEATADALTAADVSDLMTFVDGLATPTPLPPVPSPNVPSVPPQ